MPQSQWLTAAAQALYQAQQVEFPDATLLAPEFIAQLEGTEVAWLLGDSPEVWASTYTGY